MTATPTPRASPAQVPEPKPERPPAGEILIDLFIKHRKAKGWTQEEAAEQMKMSVNSLRAYERKSRRPNGAATLKILNLMGALK